MTHPQQAMHAGGTAQGMCVARLLHEHLLLSEALADAKLSMLLFRPDSVGQSTCAQQLSDQYQSSTSTRHLPHSHALSAVVDGVSSFKLQNAQNAVRETAKRVAFGNAPWSTETSAAFAYFGRGAELTFAISCFWEACK